MFSSIHVTGFAYGVTVSDHDHVQVPRVAFVAHGVITIFEISFPLGFVIVTVESVIVEPLRVVEAEKTTLGGKVTVFEDLFPALSKTVIVIECRASSGSSVSTTGLVAGSIVTPLPIHEVPLSELYVTVK